MQRLSVQLMLVLCFHVPLVAAAGSTTHGNSAGGPDTLYMEIGPSPAGDYFGHLLRLFQTHTGTRVELRQSPRPMQSLEPGREADIVCTSHDVILALAAAGKLQPLDLSPSLADAYLQIARDAVTVDGKVMAYPVSLYGPLLIYNRKLLPDPKSMESFLGAEGDGAVPGIDWDYNDARLSWGLFSSPKRSTFLFADGKLDGKRTSFAPDNGRAVTGLKLLRRMVESGRLPAQTSQEQARKRFLNGEVAATIDYPWFLPQVNDSGIEVGVSAMPSLEGIPSGAPLLVWACAITRDARTDKARDFLETYVLTGSAPERLFSDGTWFGLPAHRNAFRTLYGKPSLYTVQQSAALKVATPVMGPVVERRFWSIVSDAIREVVAGGVTAEQALTAAEQQIERP